MPPNHADLRIDPEWIVPVEPANAVLYRQSLLVRDGRIAAIVPRDLADDWECGEHLVLPGHCLIPGLVNLHTHAAMTLLRGYADDLPLMTWLHDHIWPAEARHMSADFVRDGSRIACAEMLEGGVTCFNDMYFFPEATLEAAVETGLRIACGLIVADFPSAYAGDADAYLQQGLALRDAWRDHPLVRFTLAPHAPYSVGDRSLEKVVTYAEQLDLPVHMHIHETEDEIRQGLEKYGLRPLARLNNLGLLTPGLTAVHAVHLTPGEIELLAGHGCHVAHCPASNLKLASGFAPVAGLLAAGVNTGLGTDGAASNNRLDLMGEMRLAALLAKGVSGNAAALPAHQALAMATLAGARALGMGDEIGSLTVGKQADLAAVDLTSPAHQPCYDPVSHLVYSAGREEVRHVWVAGRQVVRDGRALQVDHARLAAQAQGWRERIGHHS
ncbi:MAG: TRZ/ATZ family hydrolase [Betaproteobacteria bacterium]|nr:TRZ/ATZ family hydrolase [Betaproteobacteria bacterium]